MINRPLASPNEYVDVVLACNYQGSPKTFISLRVRIIEIQRRYTNLDVLRWADSWLSAVPVWIVVATHERADGFGRVEITPVAVRCATLGGGTGGTGATPMHLGI